MSTTSQVIEKLAARALAADEACEAELRRTAALRAPFHVDMTKFYEARDRAHRELDAAREVESKRLNREVIVREYERMQQQVSACDAEIARLRAVLRDANNALHERTVEHSVLLSQWADLKLKLALTLN